MIVLEKEKIIVPISNGAIFVFLHFLLFPKLMPINTLEKTESP